MAIEQFTTTVPHDTYTYDMYITANLGHRIEPALAPDSVDDALSAQTPQSKS